MTHHHYVDLILRAVAQPDNGVLLAVARQLAAAEAAHAILRSRGYGSAGLEIDAAARLVPCKN